MQNIHSRFSRAAVVVAFVIVLNLFFSYAISLVYPSPRYQDQATESQVVATPATEADCLKVGGQWTQTAVPAATVNKKTVSATTGYCDPNYTSQKTYEKVLALYERTVFVVLVVLGVLSIVASMFMANSILIQGFAWGGVLSLLIASVRYWSSANNIIHLAILAAALAALIWVAVKKLA